MINSIPERSGLVRTWPAWGGVFVPQALWLELRADALSWCIPHSKYNE